MSPFAIASLVFVCSSGAALVGMVLHVTLPDHHLDPDSREARPGLADASVVVMEGQSLADAAVLCSWAILYLREE